MLTDETLPPTHNRPQRPALPNFVPPCSEVTLQLVSLVLMSSSLGLPDACFLPAVWVLSVSAACCGTRHWLSSKFGLLFRQLCIVRLFACRALVSSTMVLVGSSQYKNILCDGWMWSAGLFSSDSLGFFILLSLTHPSLSLPRSLSFSLSLLITLPQCFSLF